MSVGTNWGRFVTNIQLEEVARRERGIKSVKKADNSIRARN